MVRSKLSVAAFSGTPVTVFLVITRFGRSNSQTAAASSASVRTAVRISGTSLSVGPSSAASNSLL